MKICSYILNTILVVGIIAYIIGIGIHSMDSITISTELDVKKLKSSDLVNFKENQVVEEKQDDLINIQDDVENSVEEEVSKYSQEKECITEEVSDVLETQIGSLSGYGPDCVGCSGFLASGLDVRSGNIYYSDSTYGSVRILAGDKSYPYGTIVRVKNSRLSEFVGIVLDRGGAVGFGKSHLFDLLYQTSSEALKNEVSYNTTFEILRYGY
ncbi:MAG: hypothetical protein PUE33_05955 [bacterium]|nr:hypothetical protein [bacterium]